MHPYETNRKSLQGRLLPNREVEDLLSGDQRIPFSDNLRWKKFSTNGQTHCAIADDDTLWAWGSPPVGDGTLLFRPEPVMISGDRWVDVSVGYNGDAAVASLGGPINLSVPDKPRFFGEPPQDVSEPWGGGPGAFESASQTTVLAVRSDGSVYGWGANGRGQLGNGKASRPFVLFARLKISSQIAAFRPLPKDYLGRDPFELLALGFFSSMITAPSSSFDLEDLQIVPVKHDLYNDPGSGADISPVMRRRVLNVSIGNAGSGYTSAPSCELYAVDENGGEVEFDPESEVPNLTAKMQYTVTGVEILESQPYRGQVKVLFSAGQNGATAEGECVVGQDGRVQSVNITSGGVYHDSPPALRFYGTSGSVNARVIVSGFVRAIAKDSEGYLVEKANRIRVRSSDPVGHQGVSFTPSTISFTRSFDRVNIRSGGAGYTYPSGKKFLAAIDLTDFAQQSGDVFLGNGRWGVIVGEFDLSHSAVSSIDVSNAAPVKDSSGRYILEDSLLSNSRPHTINSGLSRSAFIPPVVLSGEELKAEVIWPGTNIPAVPLSVVNEISPSLPWLRQWTATLIQDIEDSHSQTRPLLKITTPPSAEEWGDPVGHWDRSVPLGDTIVELEAQQFTGEISIVRHEKPPESHAKVNGGLGVYAYEPGVRYRQINQELFGSSSLSFVGKYANGDFMRDSGELKTKAVVEWDVDIAILQQSIGTVMAWVNSAPEFGPFGNAEANEKRNEYLELVAEVRGLAQGLQGVGSNRVRAINTANLRDMSNKIHEAANGPIAWLYQNFFIEYETAIAIWFTDGSVYRNAQLAAEKLVSIADFAEQVVHNYGAFYVDMIYQDGRAFLHQSRREQPETCYYEWLGPDSPRGYTLDDFSVYYAGGEARGGSSVSVSAYCDDATSDSHRLLSLSISTAGSEYASEPIAIVTNIYLSPVPAATGVSCTSVCLRGASASAVSGGAVYQWGLGSYGKTLTPAKKGYPLTISVSGLPSVVTDGPPAPDAHLTPMLTPQCRGYYSTPCESLVAWPAVGPEEFGLYGHGEISYFSEHTKFEPGVTDYSPAKPANYKAAWPVSAGGFYGVSGSLGSRFVEFANKGISESASDLVNKLIAQQGVMHRTTVLEGYTSSVSGAIEGASVSSLVGKPAEPVKAIYRQDKPSAFVAKDADDNLWSLA